MTFRPPASDPTMEVWQGNPDSADPGDGVPRPLEYVPIAEPPENPCPAPPLPRLFHATLRGTAVSGGVYGIPELVEMNHPYRRRVKVISPQNVADVQLSYDEAFKEPNYATISAPDIAIPVYPGQMLWLRQNAADDLNVSISVEPVGPGRG